MQGTFRTLYKYYLPEFSLQPCEVVCEAQRGKAIFPGHQPVSGELQGQTQTVRLWSFPLDYPALLLRQGPGVWQPRLWDCPDGVRGQGGGVGETEMRGQRLGTLCSAVVFGKDTPHHVISY